MRCFILAVCGASLFLTVDPTSSQAASRIWIAPSGNDGGACSREAPCRTLEYAVSKVDSGGEITCADSGNFPAGNLFINKPITVNCEGVVATTENVTNDQGNNQSNIIIQIQASGTVTLRGIDIDRVGTGYTGLSFTGAGTLILDRMKISNGVGDAYSGVSFQPNGPGRLVVTDSLITGFGSSAGGAGILVKPQAGGTAQVTLERVNVSANRFGIAADGSSSTGGINMTVADTVAASNGNDGIVATTSSRHAPVGLMVRNTKSTNNGYGIRSIGPNVTVRVDGSTVVGNGTGLATLSGGALLSAHTNVAEANGVNGAFSGSIVLK